MDMFVHILSSRFIMIKHGSKVWYVPDGFYNSKSLGNSKSHEAICVLNTNQNDAHINITLYFEDKEKLSDFSAICKAERTNHIRMDKIKNKKGLGVPTDVPYAMVIESNENIVVQYSRLDSSQAEMALMTTIAYPLE
jgi:hypothetical protein